MGRKTITKVMKFPLIYLDGCGDYRNLNKELWEIQKQVREICNFTIQELYYWDHEDKKHFTATGEHLSLKDQTGYKRIDGYVYDQLKESYPNIGSLCKNDAIQKAYKKYKDSKSEVWKGHISVPSYKADQPIPLHKKLLHFTRDPEYGLIVVIDVFSERYRKIADYQKLRFSMKTYDGTQKAIIERIEKGEYQYGQCQLVFNKKSWELLLTYTFIPPENTLDPEKILGVDMGAVYALYASSKGNHGTFKIPGDEVDQYARKLEAIKYAKQSQARYCGDGRIGHGTKTRVAPVYDAQDAIARFRDTINHRYSRALIDFAVKNGYGVIQIEDLTGIKQSTGFPRRLQHWTYYDLQTKIKNKAAEAGITVKMISPGYTSQRCSQCGNIDKANRPTQDTFLCTACGYKTNADYNASQNISIPDIDKIIQKEKKKNANPEETE